MNKPWFCQFALRKPNLLANFCQKFSLISTKDFYVSLISYSLSISVFIILSFLLLAGDLVTFLYLLCTRWEGPLCFPCFLLPFPQWETFPFCLFPISSLSPSSSLPHPSCSLSSYFLLFLRFMTECLFSKRMNFIATFSPHLYSIL